MTGRILALALLAAGCQHDVTTQFPSGLAPLEDNPVPEQAGSPYTETLATSSETSDYIHVYGRGYILVPPAVAWQATMTPGADVALCNTNQQIITPNNDPTYAFSFLVHYVVNDVLTVEWDDQWRFGVIDGTSDAPALGMIRHQKVDGSSFITRSEGTIQVLATDDPGVTELAFVEHLKAVSGSADDVLKNIDHNFASLVAIAHGKPIPACP